MKFDKEKCLIKDNSNIKVYIDKVDSDESIILDSEYVFLDSIKTTMDILVMKKTVVLGDIECNFLNAVDEIICYGNISANSIYTNKDIEYFKEIKYNNLLSGNLKKKGNNEENVREIIKEVPVEITKEVEVIKEVLIEKEVEIEVNTLEYTEITSKNLVDKLSVVDEFKDNILKYVEGDLIFLEDDVLAEDLKEIGLTFEEYKKYSSALTKVINYSTIDNLETINEGLEFIGVIGELPDFLEYQDIVENTIDKHKKVFTHEILDMKINCESKDEFIKLLSSLEKCKKQIEDDYDEIANKIINHYYENQFIKASSNNSKKVEIIEDKKDTEKEESIADIFKELANEELNKKEEAQNKVDLDELYEKYIWKKGSLVICKVTKVLDDCVVVEEIENSDNENILMTIDTNVSKYSIGDRIYACISDIKVEENKLKVMLSNDQDNMPRLLFNKLKELYDLNKCSIQKYKRIKGKSTCIVIVLLSKINYKDAIEDITKEMEKQLNNETVSIFVYDNDEAKFASNILGISKNCINIDKLQNKCIATVNKVEEEKINKLLKLQETNIKNIFGYEIVVKPQENKGEQIYKDFGDIIKVSQPKTEVKNIPTKVETKIEVIDKPSIKTKPTVMSHRDTYMNLLSKKGKILGGKITSIDSSDVIHLESEYNTEVVIKHFDKKTIEQYKVGDYIEGVVDGISKKPDGTIKATLSRLRVEFIKVLLKTIRDEIGLKDITFKAAKMLKSKEEFAVLYTSTLNNITDNHIAKMKEKVEERLNGEKVKFYKYDFKLINQINNITGIKIKDARKIDKESKCIITCDAKDETIIKSFTEVLEYFTLCRNIEVVCEVKTKNSTENTTIIAPTMVKKVGNIEEKELPIVNSEFKALIRKYSEYKWTIVEGVVTDTSNNKVELNINNEVVGVLNKNNELVENKSYKVGEKIPCYVFDVLEKNNRVELSLMKSSENYFKQLFKYYKNQLGINLISIKSCVFEKNKGALILIENRYKKVTKEELEFIEELMNNECGGDIVKLVEFSYNADKFMCDLFDIMPKDIVKASGKYYLSNLNYSKMDKYRFIHEKISNIVNYKIVI